MQNVQVIRKVKCDETKPACRRCSVTGRQCEGYQMEARHVASADEAQDSAGYHMNADLELYRPSAVPNQSPTEARYLQYFSEKTVAQLTFFFPDDLWNVTILQVAQSHPSVRHALSSLSWYHERFVRPTTDLGNEASFALVQYNLAIKHVLVEQEPSQPVHIGIISCLLFVCIESLRGNLTTAMHLYKYGRQIIQDARQYLIGGASRWDAFGSEEFLCAMEAVFLPLGIQMSLLVGDVDPDFPSACPIYPRQGRVLHAISIYQPARSAR
ncbi:hypothetical protein BJ166DRAFT_116403 [Pestalotiopsis sp. NC0098]|nr:hypothetical protein BJ166DRAFT_116403 [Pestalotiopsis sp. NC0098]